MVNRPLIRPYFLGGGIGGYTVQETLHIPKNPLVRPDPKPPRRGQDLTNRQVKRLRPGFLMLGVFLVENFSTVAKGQPLGGSSQLVSG